MEIRLLPEQAAHIVAVAENSNRSTGDLVMEAVALWEELRMQQRKALQRKHSPAEAVARILELRKDNNLPEGLTIRDLINYGRA